MDATQDDCTWSPAHHPIFYTASHQSDGRGIRGDQGGAVWPGAVEGWGGTLRWGGTSTGELVETVKSGLIEIS